MSILRLHDEQLVIYCTYDDRHTVKKVGAKWNPSDKSWIMPFTVSNVEFLVQHINNLNLTPDVTARLEKQREIEQKLLKIRKLAKLDKPVKFRVPGVNLSLYNYQKLGVMYALTNPNGLLLADDMGLGKTIQGIATACYKKYNEGIKNCLVVVPASLKWNWPLEIEKFTDEKYVVIDGSPKDREEQWLRNDVFFYIVNYELVLEDLFGGRDYHITADDDEKTVRRKEKMSASSQERAKKLEAVKERSWGMVLLDEVQAIKSHYSKRSKNVKSIKSPYRMALSGTPMDGRLEELHSIMEFVVPGLLEPKTRFLQHHAEFDFWGKIVKYKGVDEVKKRISNFFLRRLKKDVLKDLPDKIYENKILTLSPEELKIYKELADKGHVITEDAEAMVAVIRCKQFCDHPDIIGLTTAKNSKMDAFKEVIDEIVLQNSNKVIIFTQYATMGEKLKKVLEEMGLKYLYICGDTDKKVRADMQEQFNKDATIDVMLGTDAMSAGLNFTAANYVVNYDDAWSPSTMSQREDRAHRIGQKNVVTVINFICKDTIEERIRGVLYNKSVISAQALGDETDEMMLRRVGPKDFAKLL